MPILPRSSHRAVALAVAKRRSGHVTPHPTRSPALSGCRADRSAAIAWSRAPRLLYTSLLTLPLTLRNASVALFISAIRRWRTIARTRRSTRSTRCYDIHREGVVIIGWTLHSAIYSLRCNNYKILRD